MAEDAGLLAFTQVSQRDQDVIPRIQLQDGISAWFQAIRRKFSGIRSGLQNTAVQRARQIPVKLLGVRRTPRNSWFDRPKACFLC